MRKACVLFVSCLDLPVTSCGESRKAILDNADDILPDIFSCGELVASGARPIAADRTARFQGKVQEATARCRGGTKAVAHRDVPWTDWGNYWATGDTGTTSWLSSKNTRGINGSLIDLEYSRIELIKFNLFDNSGTYRQYVTGPSIAGSGVVQQGGTVVDGAAIKTWPDMRLLAGHPNYRDVGGDSA